MSWNQEALILNFVLKNEYQREEDAAPDMRDAHKSAVDFGMQCRWIKELDCMQIDEEVRGQVFVFQEFDGEIFFRFVKSHINRVIGPKCLLTCISGGIPIPNTKYPVLSLAMNKLTVCASGVSVEQKKEMEKLVGYMGGRFCNKFLSSTTHLVVNSVMSEKYFKAREQGIPIMIRTWIEDIWKRTSISNNEENDDMINEYKVPIFYNLKVTASALTEKEKNEIKEIIRCRGGIYTPEMRKETDVLILPEGKGEKFRFAERWKIKCLHPSWIKRCLEEGYTVRYKDFIVKSIEKKCSTPVNTCNKMASLMNANDSEISVISCDSARTAVGETQVDSLLMARKPIFKTPVKCTPRTQCSPKTDNSVNHQSLLNDIALTDVKKCGSLLDGCKVYLSGFKDNEEEKLRRILNYGGAIRYTELNSSVTHVIVGNPNKHDLDNIKAVNHTPHVVTLKWLSTSIKKGCLEKESNCSYFLEDKRDEPQTSRVPQQPSPLSRKGLQMLNPVQDISSNPEPSIDHNLIEKYSRTLEPIPEPPPEKSDRTNGADSTIDSTTQNSTNVNLFAGLMFAIMEHESSARDHIEKIIDSFHGSVSDELCRVDYIIVPVTVREGLPQNLGMAEVVTSVWMEECLSENKIVDSQYYHRPLIVSRPLNSRPLSDHVITFSSYSTYEKQYLEKVADFLGARCQDVLSRKENAARSIARSTHLVCDTPQGLKYNAAKKWNLPIIYKQWLLDSFSQRRVLPLDSYLLSENESNQTEKGRNDGHKNGTILQEKETTSRQGTSTNETLSKIVIGAQNNGTVLHGKETSRQETPVSKSESYPIPTLTEAVKNTLNKCGFAKSKRLKETPETENYPHGLLAQFNRQTSFTKRKNEDSDTETNESDSHSRKLFRPDIPATPSSQEGVGWRDTFTDVSLDNLHNECTNPESKQSSVAGTRSNNEPIGSVGLPGSDTGGKSQKQASDGPINREHDPPDGTNAEQQNSCLRTNQLLKNKTSPRNILISINVNAKKLQCEATINELGGRVISRYDPDCPETERATHLIIDDLKKTEKLLCSIANGLWVLHSMYLDHCKQSGKFLNEEPFEWGNPSRIIPLPTKESKEQSAIAKAAHRWRRVIQTEGPSRRPFVEMKAVIVTSAKDESMQSLARVVKSGGGTVLPLNNILECTHCLVMSVKNVDHIPVPLRDLAARKIHYLPAVYLSDYLMSDPPPKPEGCYFDSYKRLL